MFFAQAKSALPIALCGSYQIVVILLGLIVER
ncbi:hypothetical protein CJA_2351 [Cellvibrio japonicus Ueda107]|uniref:Uncharacterized protein n=1 Tax=Cellvibrio japonicus (strain Ueda107) TaxID=498211 RepID=B3PJY9_CELJU|nr:hypothetical protein CJA_2351 [Cellvibrio japonicus Ueda107]